MYTNSYIRIWHPYKSNEVDLGGGGNVWWTAKLWSEAEKED